MPTKKQVCQADNQTLLLDQLRAILELQLAGARNSNMPKVERLAGQAGDIIERLEKSKIPNDDASRQKNRQIAELYRKLNLVLTARKEQTKTDLKKIRQGKKTISAYYNYV